MNACTLKQVRSMKNKILVVDPLDTDTMMRLRDTYDLVEKLNPSLEELGSYIGESEVLIMRSGV